jgi:nucleoside-diphosphate-sugar epimerase
LANNLLISGGTGFFGKNLLKYCLEHQSSLTGFDEIIVISRNKERFITSYPEFVHPRITYVEADIRTFELDRTDINYILHLATDARKTLNDNVPLEMMDIIMNGTKHMLEFAARQKDLKSFLFTSSGAVYGNIPEEIDGVREEQRFDMDFNNPYNAYAHAKQTAEMMCSVYKDRFGINVIIARCFAFYGDYLPLNTHFAIGNFIKNARELGKIIINSDGTPRRSYMHSQDLAYCLLTLLQKECNDEYIFNVGSSEGHTLKEWAERIAEKIGDVEVEIRGEILQGYSAGSNYIPNCDRLQLLTGDLVFSDIIKTI